VNDCFIEGESCASRIEWFVPCFGASGHRSRFSHRGLPEDMDTADPTAIGGGSIVIHK
jgi:hypothetical protein